MCRGSVLLRSQAFAPQQKLINEHEETLHQVDKYSYNKKPGGFWKDPGYEHLIQRQEIRKKAIINLEKQQENTNSSWLLKGPHCGVGPYKKNVKEKGVFIRRAERIRHSTIMEGNNKTK